MRKLCTLLVFVLICSLTFATTSFAKSKKADSTEQTKVETQIQTKEKTETETAETAENQSETNNADEDYIENPVETITVEEMNERLKNSSDDDVIYVKRKQEEEEFVEVYEGFATDRSLRKQFILTAPHTEMFRLYTTNKASFNQIYKMLSDYESENANFDGYKIITDKDNARKLEDGKKLYRCWFMKIEREQDSRRGGWRIPIGIGIGWGWGGHHHHHHGGPGIGIGW